MTTPEKISSGSAITIVSGLPRSGTSMAMAMLEAGGMPLLCDGLRPVDDSNPHGYYEYDPVKRLRNEASWLAEARGKGVKVISYLLDALPPEEQYRILFMRRSLDEILASQRAMLTRMGKKTGGDDSPLRDVMAKHLAHIKKWIAAQPNIDILYLEHHDSITDPAATARHITDFLQHPLDTHAMASVVDPALHREHA